MKADVVLRDIGTIMVLVGFVSVAWRCGAKGNVWATVLVGGFATSVAGIVIVSPPSQTLGYILFVIGGLGACLGAISIKLAPEQSASGSSGEKKPD